MPASNRDLVAALVAIIENVESESAENSIGQTWIFIAAQLSSEPKSCDVGRGSKEFGAVQSVNYARNTSSKVTKSSDGGSSRHGANERRSFGRDWWGVTSSTRMFERRFGLQRGFGWHGEADVPAWWCSLPKQAIESPGIGRATANSRRPAKAVQVRRRGFREEGVAIRPRCNPARQLAKSRTRVGSNAENRQRRRRS